MQAAHNATKDCSLAALEQSAVAMSQLAAAQDAFSAATPAKLPAEADSGSSSSTISNATRTESSDLSECADEDSATAVELARLQNSNADLRHQLSTALLQLSFVAPRRSDGSRRLPGASVSPLRTAPAAGSALLQFGSPGGSAILGAPPHTCGQGYESEGQDGYYTAGEVPTPSPLTHSHTQHHHCRHNRTLRPGGGGGGIYPGPEYIFNSLMFVDQSRPPTPQQLVSHSLLCR